MNELINGDYSLMKNWNTCIHGYIKNTSIYNNDYFKEELDKFKDIHGENYWDHSGHSVSLSNDGNIVAIGSPNICNDKSDAESLYQLLENEVVPTFYNDSKKWAYIMRNSIQTSVEFTAHRMIKEYQDKFYRYQTQEVLSKSQ